MAGNFTPTPRKKIALDNRKLNLSARVPNVEPAKYASLIWGLYSNNPRLTVYTNDPNDTGEQNNNGKISANLDAPTFFAFLNALNGIIDGANDQKLKVNNKNFIFPGGKRSERPVAVSELWAGKDADGVVWISVVDAMKRERPKIKFKFKMPDFHEIVHGDGRPFSEAEASVAVAKGYVKLLEQMMAHLMVTEWTEPPPPKEGGGGGRGNWGGGGGGNRGGGGGNWGGGGGGNRGGYGGGGGGGGSDDAGEEIPF